MFKSPLRSAANVKPLRAGVPSLVPPSPLTCMENSGAGDGMGGGDPRADETRAAGKVEIRSTKGRSSDASCPINVANLVCCCFSMNYSGLRSTEASTKVSAQPNAE